jgi:hypothetical protein
LDFYQVVESASHSLKSPFDRGKSCKVALD